MGDLQGKTALVTGASRGIGLTVAKELIAAQLDPEASDASIEGSREGLNLIYDRYVKKHGPVNGKKSEKPGSKL